MALTRRQFGKLLAGTALGGVLPVVSLPAAQPVTRLGVDLANGNDCTVTIIGLPRKNGKTEIMLAAYYNNGFMSRDELRRLGSVA